MTSVVIADDHSFFRSGLEAVLSGAGYDVVASVGDGDSALDAIAKEHPDLVILDVRMPGRDGISTLKALREQDTNLPVVLLAAEFEDEALKGAITARANAIVNKAGAETKLLDALSAVQSGGQFFEAGSLERYLTLTAAGAEPKPADKLNARERAIAEEVAKGSKNRQIADKHGMSEAMVKLHLHRIYVRLGIKNRTELALFIRNSQPN